MSKISSNIKCADCGVFTANSDYCKNCGALISHKRKLELRAEQIKQQQIEEAKRALENPNFVERLKKHPFFLLKIVGWFLYSVWFVVSMIGASLAWFIAMVAAG